MAQHRACPNIWPSCFRMILEHFARHPTICRTLQDVSRRTKKNREGSGACLSFPKNFTDIKREEKDYLHSFRIKRCWSLHQWEGLGISVHISHHVERQSFYINYYVDYQEDSVWQSTKSLGEGGQQMEGVTVWNHMDWTRERCWALWCWNRKHRACSLRCYIKLQTRALSRAACSSTSPQRCRPTAVLQQQLQKLK